MHLHSDQFVNKAHQALNNESLQKNLRFVRQKFIDKRRRGVEDYGPAEHFEALRDQGNRIRQQAVMHLPKLLQQFETQAQKQGTVVLWAENPSMAAQMVIAIAQAHHVKKVVKSKSMLSEEANINEALVQAGIEPIETDLGEYILQINNNESPSHIIAPVMHKSKEEVSALFAKVHQKKPHTDITAMTQEAREVLRHHFFSADMGLSGANFLIAETGSVALVTNEGNGRMCTTIPNVHVAIAGIEKVIPSLEDLSVLLRLLTRSATGQSISNYVSVLTGTRRVLDQAAHDNGPRHHYVILVDGERTSLLGTPFQTMLQCIRCGACMNHCPVYQSVGGHAYGWVYPGPMGSVLTPLFQGLKNTKDLPQAATLCNQCGDVCPVRIPLSQLLRQLREKQFDERLSSWWEKIALRLWREFAIRPALYHGLGSLMIRCLRLLRQSDGMIHALPFRHKGWTTARYFPAPSQKTFQALWKDRQSGRMP